MMFGCTGIKRKRRFSEIIHPAVNINVYHPLHMGRMAGMLIGLFENRGIYCHVKGFKIVMEKDCLKTYFLCLKVSWRKCYSSKK